MENSITEHTYAFTNRVDEEFIIVSRGKIPDSIIAKVIESETSMSELPDDYQFVTINEYSTRMINVPWLITTPGEFNLCIKCIKSPDFIMDVIILDEVENLLKHIDEEPESTRCYITYITPTFPVCTLTWHVGRMPKSDVDQVTSGIHDICAKHNVSAIRNIEDYQYAPELSLTFSPGDYDRNPTEQQLSDTRQVAEVIKGEVKEFLKSIGFSQERIYAMGRPWMPTLPW